MQKLRLNVNLAPVQIRVLPTAEQSIISQLAERLAKKEREVIDEIYHRFAPALLGMIMKLIPDQAAAEDVLQESFVKIWQNGDRYDAGKGRLFTWMLNICRNTALDYLKSSAFKQSSNQVVPMFDDENEPDSRYGFTEQKTDTIGFKEAMQMLGPENHEIIDLIYIKGYTQDETSQMLGIPLGTIKSRARNSIQKLKVIFNR